MFDDYLHVPGNWLGLWQQNIPPKVKNFAWRVSREVLPNRDTLRSRGVMVPSACVFCDSAVENSWHLFLGCGFSTNCWQAASFASIIDNLVSSIDGFTQWLFLVIDSVKELVLSKIMIILWSMGRERNGRLWNNVQRPPSLVTLHDIAYLYEWVQVKEKNYSSQTPCLISVCPKWHPPPHSWLKCNCDLLLFFIVVNSVWRLY